MFDPQLPDAAVVAAISEGARAEAAAAACRLAGQPAAVPGPVPAHRRITHCPNRIPAIR
ncbi:MAG TPA: hypothetical protein VMS84_12415 [Mycobacterium sp.]|nr:hypothetical protein [Mycobacterium sp.]